jgi:hypothetical protein
MHVFVEERQRKIYSLDCSQKIYITERLRDRSLFMAGVGAEEKMVG